MALLKNMLIIVTNQADEAFARLNKRSVHAVHLVVKSARVAQVVAGAVPAPQRSRNRPAVDALTTLA